MVALGIAVVALVIGIAWWRNRAQPEVPRVRGQRFISEATGVPVVPIDDYGSRRLARGSTPPPLPAEGVPLTLGLRPRLKKLTPRALGDVWDLSDRDR